jgi:ABC-type transport system involved in multi-copper enzyme maturation permease subunit
MFVFLYGISTFVSSSSVATSSINASGITTQSWIYNVTSSLLGFPLVIFAILMLKNLAYGLGSDIEKGIIQVFLSYPLKRRRLLTAKLISAVGVPLTIFLGIQFIALYVLAPDALRTQLFVVALTFAAGLAMPLVLGGAVLILSLVSRKGGLALVSGIVLFFGLQLSQGLSRLVASSTGSAVALKIISLVSPSVALSAYFGAGVGTLSSLPWHPSLVDVQESVGASYAFSVSLFVVAYLYFSRRFEL